jgi:hypothetical protein
VRKKHRSGVSADFFLNKPKKTQKKPKKKPWRECENFRYDSADIAKKGKN